MYLIRIAIEIRSTCSKSRVVFEYLVTAANSLYFSDGFVKLKQIHHSHSNDFDCFRDSCLSNKMA